MRRLHLLFFAVALCFVLSSCKKQSSVATTESFTEHSPPPVAEAAQNNSNSPYRLTGVEWPFGNYNFQYNANGLCSVMSIDGMGNFQQTYNAAGRLLQSKHYMDGMLEATIVFQYGNNGLANKETRYIGNTSDKLDEIFITRNSQGRITRLESFMNDYYITAQYSPQGNNTAWQLYVSSQLAYDVQVRYNQSIKNQFEAVKGIDYGFPFVNGFMFQSKFTSAGEKFTIYDEYGNAYVLYDYNADMCLTIPGFQNYPSSSDWFDNISQGWVMYNYYYNNGASSARGSNRSMPGNSIATKDQLQNLLFINKGAASIQNLLSTKNQLVRSIKTKN